MSNKERHDLQLEGLLDEIDRSIIQASDAEVVEDAKVAGVNLVTNAANLKQRFLTAARAYQKRKFAQAKQDYTREVKALDERQFKIPPSAAEQRVLLQLTIAHQTQKGLALTAKFRDFENLPDSDLPELLQELGALGLLPEPDKKD